MGICLAIIQAGAQSSPPSPSAAVNPALPAPTAWQITQRAANSRVWERSVPERSPSGGIVGKKHTFTELGTGICYQDATTGQWLDAQEQISLQPDGSATATSGRHQVCFPADIYNGVIQVVTPDGQHLKSRPIGLSFDDGQHTVLLAELTHSVGQLVGANQVVYPNCFTGLKADLLFTYSKAGLEQDIVLRQRPPSASSWGLNSQTARLQVLT